MFSFYVSISSSAFWMETSASYSDSGFEELHLLPQKCDTLKVLGEVSFGEVLRCLDLQTNQIVAKKRAKRNESLRYEVGHGL